MTQITPMLIFIIIITLILIVFGVSKLFSKKQVQPPAENVRPAVVKPKVKKSSFRKIIDELMLEEGRYYDHLYFTDGDDKDRIDNIFVNPKGIFVMRFLDIDGWVLGSGESRWWTHFKSSDEKEFMDNPIRKAKADIDRLMQVFPKQKKSMCYVYIVFSDHCDLSAIERVGETRIVRKSGLYDQLKKDMRTLPEVFSDNAYYRLLRVADVMSTSKNLDQRMEELRIRFETEEVEGKAFHDEVAKAEAAFNTSAPEIHFTRAEIELRDALTIWRKQMAVRKGVTDFEIFDNRTLDKIVMHKPKTMQALYFIPGMDHQRCELYGKAIISMIEHAPEM